MADTKYQLTLEGSKVDDALQQLNQRVAEGWAVGTRDGAPVPSSSQYYQNNARYYAQRAESIAPASVTEAVRWDIPQTALTDENKAQARENIDAVGSSSAVQVVEQTFTDSEKAQARKNIAAGGTNPNLLDNPWWGSGEVINQRGVTAKVSNGAYSIDRWILTSGADANAWSIAENGITFTIASSSIWYTQRIANPSAWSGKTLTASALLSDGTIKSGSVAFTYGTAAIFYDDSALNLSMNTSGQFVLAIRSTQTIRAVKLELGSVSTLANDLPPDYGTELAKCQRYFLRLEGGYRIFGVGDALSTAQIRIFVPTPVSMYKKSGATVTMSGGIVLRSIHNSALTPTAMSLDSILINGVDLVFTVSGATQYAVYLGVQSGSNNPIDISCDL